jgi:lipoprotein signal peptidase
VIRVLVLLVSVSAAAASVDLGHKALATSSAELAHDRSALYLAGGAAASLFWAGLITLTRSPSIALAGGVLLGGAAGNLASVALWPEGVPNPLVARGIAFNLADISAVLGLALLVPAILVFAVQNRQRLFEPV